MMQKQTVDEVPIRKKFLEKYEIKDIRIAKNLKALKVIARKWRGNENAHFDYKDRVVLNTRRDQYV